MERFSNFSAPGAKANRLKEMRFALRLEFDGSNFCGWQEQSQKMEKASIPSIQRTLQKAFGKLLGTRKRVLVQGCGRTDSGVHAEEFVAHVDIDEKLFKKFKNESRRLRLGLNAVLPAAISVKELIEVEEKFHALHDVVSKRYEYRILLRMTRPALERGRVWWIPTSPDTHDFDTRLLKKSMKDLEGRKDFAAFANAGHSVKTTVRTIHNVELEEEPRGTDRGKLLRITFEGDGFLKQQIRNMVGSLVAIAQKKQNVNFLQQLLSASNGPSTRISGLFCAPPEGLFLMRVKYDRSIFPSEA